MIMQLTRSIMNLYLQIWLFLNNKHLREGIANKIEGLGQQFNIVERMIDVERDEALEQDVENSESPGHF